MSRTRKATITAAFAYLQFGVAILSGIVLVPLTLHYIGARSWGLWLATGELLGYAGMTDLGVLGVLPWMIAEADGRQDRAAMRRLVGHGVWIGSAVTLLYVMVAGVLWAILPGALHLAEPDRSLLAGPFAALVLANALSHPFRVFRALLGGLQDAWFNGVLSILHSALTMGITIVLMMKGFGLFALAIGAGLPPFITFALSIARVRAIAPDLMTGWTRPSIADARFLLTNGTGVWLAAMGWQLLSASNAIILTFLGHPEWVPIYNCTSRLSVMATQLTWVPPDSALVGVAQLHGEHRGPERLRQVVLMLGRLHLLLSGAALCGLLAFNPAFVSRWVGVEFFGGPALNGLMAAGVVVYSVVHGLITTASVIGNRLKVGVVTLVNGLVQAAIALVFGRWWGLDGIATAGLVAAFVTAIPVGIRLLQPTTGLTAADLFRELMSPWLLRVSAIVVLAAIAGAFSIPIGLIGSGVIAAALVLLYVWQMRPLYPGLPLDPRWAHWLVRIRLMPSPVTPPRAALDQV